MKRRNRSGIRVLAALAPVALLGACASTPPDAVEERRLASEAEQCAAGEVYACHSSSTGRISDGRFGRRNGRMQFCSCQPEVDLERMRDISLPAEN